MVDYVEIEAKSIIQKQKYRDNWFWNRYGINPYRGCQFACNYCDALTEKYLVHKDYKDFSRIIYVKRNAPELLEKEVKTRKPDVVAMSGVTDPYQPAEKKYGLTRKILETIEDLNESITGICKRKALDKLPGVGKGISRVIEEFLVNAKRERLEKEMNTE